MKIDIKPNIRTANEAEKVIIEVREIPALYNVLTSDGNPFSVMFDDKSLAEFVPSRTVSEMLKNWQEGINRQLNLYKNSIKQKIHPYWTRSTETMVHYPQYAGNSELEYRWNGKYHDEPVQMTKEQIKFFQKEVERLEKIKGPLTFEKVIVQ